MTIATASAYGRSIAKGPYGYSQSSDPKTGRTSGLDHRPGNFDCSFATGAICYKGGFITRNDLKGTFYSGNIVSRLVSTKMYYAIDISKLSFSRQKAMLREGDVVRGPGHVVYALGGGKVVSFEQSERGTHYGKPGDQTGKEGRIRDFYVRSRGWTHIVRPYNSTTHLGRVIADYSAGRSRRTNEDRLIRRAPWDGPRWRAFMTTWETLDKGMEFNYDPTDMPWPNPPPNHIYVVLGSALTAGGRITSKYRRRLELVASILLKFPTAKVLLSGGKPRDGVTEAAAGRSWLIGIGVKPEQIFTEEKSTSTIGNAKYSVEFLDLNEYTSYTLVSDVQHLRRAQIEFIAAQVQRETANNGVIYLTWNTPLAYNNYGSKPVAPERPVTAATRAFVAHEVAILVGAQGSFLKALN